MTTGTIVFVGLALALYLATVFSAGYRQRWWMAAIVFVALGVPIGMALGGDGAMVVVGVAVMLVLAVVAWVFGRRYRASRASEQRPPRDRPDLFDERP